MPMEDLDNFEENEIEWIADYITEFLSSPTWEIPVMYFIEENCIFFENVDENKLIYTELHQEFRHLIEDLLITNLAEVGLTIDTFMAALQEYRRFSKDLDETIIHQILSIDDFLIFKNMMIKRNMEIELETVLSIQKAQNKRTKKRMRNDSSEEKDGDSNSDTEKADDEEDADGQICMMDDSDEELDEDDYRYYQKELLLKRDEIEAAEIEEAIAMSLSLQEEQLRLLSLEAKGVAMPIHRSEEISKAEAKDSGCEKPKPLLQLTWLPPTASEEEVVNILAKGKEKIEESRKTAQHALEKTREVLAEKNRDIQEEQSEEEIQKRVEYLKEQRNKLLEKKKKERDEKQTIYAKEQKQCPIEPPASLIGKQVLPTQIPSPSKSPKRAGEDEKRRALRVALGRKLKQDLLVGNEEEKPSKILPRLDDLDDKLKQVYQIRKKYAEKEDS